MEPDSEENWVFDTLSKKALVSRDFAAVLTRTVAWGLYAGLEDANRGHSFVQRVVVAAVVAGIRQELGKYLAQLLMSKS